MSNCNNTSHAFVHAKDGFELVDVKFFRGDDLSVTHEEFTKASEEIDRQMLINEPINVSEIDGHLKIVNINTVL